MTARDRLNRLLMLRQLQLNDIAERPVRGADPHWLDARDGHAAERRLLTDLAGYPSLRR